MNSSAAEVLYQLLIDLGLADSSAGEWPVYISHLPNIPDDAMAVFDTAGVTDGRIMAGPLIVHHGVQIRIRSKIYKDGLRQSTSIADTLDIQNKVVVAVESDTSYVVHNVSRQGTILSLGIDENDKQRRHGFTINAVVTFAVE